MDFKKQSNEYLEDLYNLLYDLPLEERPKKASMSRNSIIYLRRVSTNVFNVNVFP